MAVCKVCIFRAQLVLSYFRASRAYVRTHSSEMTTSGNKGDMSVVLNAAGNFVAMVVPLLVRPHKLRNAGASAADSR